MPHQAATLVACLLFPILQLRSRGVDGFSGHHPYSIQRPLQPPPRYVTSDDDYIETPTTGDDLQHVVKESYYDPLPGTIDALQHSIKITGILNKTYVFGDSLWSSIDITTPLMNTCTPVISNVRPLAEGQYCPEDQESCSNTLEFTTTDSYQSALGFSFSASVEVDVDVLIASTSVTTTFEASYEYTWSHGNTSSKSYTFNLKPGQYCTPSMVHVDLQCDVRSNDIFFDTMTDSIGNTKRLRTVENRPGGPYEGGQWCRYAYLQETILKQDEYWSTLCPQNPDEGEYWIPEPHELNDYALSGHSPPNILDDELPIRKTPGYGDVLSPGEIFVCTRPPGNANNRTVTMLAS